MVRPVVVLGVFAGCGARSDVDIVELCGESTVPVAPDAVGSVGVSGEDVVDAADGVVLETTWTSGVVTTWTLSVALDGGPVEATRAQDYVKCEAGTYLLVPVHATLGDADWLVEGHAVLEADGAGLGDIGFHWDASHLPVTSAPTDVHDDVANSRGACAGASGEREIVSFYDSTLAGGRLAYEVSFDDCVGGVVGGPFVALAE
jgi:hypothetical protein